MENIWRELLYMGYEEGSDITEDYFNEACFNVDVNPEDVNWNEFEYLYNIRILPCVIND